MAYSRLPVVITDYALGYQTANVLRDNLDDTYAALAVAHGLDESVARVNPLTRLGRHNDQRIPRACLQLGFAAGSPVLMAELTLPPGIPARVGVLAGGVVSEVTRLQAGVIFVGIQYLTRFWGTTVATGNALPSLGMRQVMCRAYPGSATQPRGIYCFSYNFLSTPAVVAVDYPFTLTIYGS